MVNPYLFTAEAHATLSSLIGRRITFAPVNGTDSFYSDGMSAYACRMEGCMPSIFYLTVTGAPVGHVPAEFFAVEATIHEFILNANASN